LTAAQQAQQDQLIAQAQLLAQAASQKNTDALAQFNTTIVSSAISAFGIGSGDLSALKGLGGAMTASQAGLAKSLETSADARALIAAKTASGPVFNRIEYTVGADRSITGQVYFVDNNGESLIYQGVGDTVNPWFDQSGSGAFFIPAPAAADYTPTLTFLVQANDTSGNVTRTQVTLDRSTPVVPPADTPPEKVLGAYASIGQLLNGAGQIASAALARNSAQQDALEKERDASTDEAQIQQYNSQIAALIQTVNDLQTQLLTNIQQIQASQNAAIARINQV
jgi:hypothetical protein